ncbi:hypothetical protein [Burkholderia stagnalis]
MSYDSYYDHRYEYSAARRKRAYILLIIIPLMLAGLLYFGRSSILYTFQSIPSSIWIFIYFGPFLLLIVGLAFLAMAYLQTGFSFRPKMRVWNYAYEEKSPRSDVVGNPTAYQDETEHEVTGTEATETISATQSAALGHADLAAGLSEYDKLIAAFLDQARKDPKDAIWADLLARAKRANGVAASDVVVNRGFDESRQRILREIESLGRRGNVNLLLGMAISIAGLAVLGAFFFSSTGSTSETRLGFDMASVASAAAAAAPPTSSLTTAKQIGEHFSGGESAEVFNFGIRFLPRLSFALLIELFAYFFLKLYKSSLSEIKYFQNEITNIEAKSLALRVALSSDSPAVTGKVLGSLMATERNCILEKGQSTVDLERAKIERLDVAELAKGASTLLEKIKGKE